jgi:hypothetical protein
VKIWRRLEAPLWMARTGRDLALVYEAAGDLGRAAQVLDRAMRTLA